MDELRDLYQEVIFDHNRKPRNFRKMRDANRKAEGFNPLCGDQLTVYMKINDQGVIKDVSFEGKGCAISTASASIMTETLIGKTQQDAERYFERFHELVTAKNSESGSSDELGKLRVLAGVREFPARVKCATLPWHTVHAAINNEETSVTTE
jgi:nitrogen fixation protein NifU and related proteins